MTHLFEDKQQYLKFREQFRTLSREKKASSIDHILFNIIRGKDPKNGFSPLKSQAKISSRYNDEWHGYTLARSAMINEIHHRATHEKMWQQKQRFDQPLTIQYKDAIPEEMWIKILEVLK